MKVVSQINPQNIEFHAYLAFARNSVGSNAVVPDEIIKARSGKRICIGNTDAEGRLVMADLICEAVENASKTPTISSTIITCATLTGHVGRAYGKSAAIVPNNVALINNLPAQLQSIGDELGESFEISRLTKEDFDFNDGGLAYVDLVSANNKPSTLTDRGHQFPAAFLIEVSGLNDHGIHSAYPISFLHLDIASVAEENHLGKATATPIASLTQLLL